jgi:hypothetical protein
MRSMSPRFGASSGWEWRRPPYVEADTAEAAAWTAHKEGGLWLTVKTSILRNITQGPLSCQPVVNTALNISVHFVTQT